VQIDYDVVHLRTFLVQLFVLLQLNFEEVVQIIELRRLGGAPNGYPFAALIKTLMGAFRESNLGPLAPKARIILLKKSQMPCFDGQCYLFIYIWGGWELCFHCKFSQLQIII
jgi:hypothetical protein